MVALRYDGLQSGLLGLRRCSDQGYVPSTFVQLQSTEEMPVDSVQQLTQYEWVATIWDTHILRKFEKLPWMNEWINEYLIYQHRYNK